MTQQLHEHLAEVLRRLAAAPAVFCFLDYDGTLAPIAPTPAEAVALPGTTELLLRLTQAPRTSIAVVTGRSIVDVRRFIDIADIHYIGVHGLESQRPGEAVELSPKALDVRALIPEIRRRIEASIGRREGILLEDKNVAIACHYRLASRADAQAARAAVIAVVESYQSRGVPVTFIDGHEVTEVRPAGMDKGEAVAALLASRQPALAVYVGDDRTDEEAFRRLPADAITVRVGDAGQETAARYVVPGPVEVQAFLRDVVAARRRPIAG